MSVDLTTFPKLKKRASLAVSMVASKKHQGKTFSDKQVTAFKGWKSDGYPEKICSKKN